MFDLPGFVISWTEFVLYDVHEYVPVLKARRGYRRLQSSEVLAEIYIIIIYPLLVTILP